MIYALFFAVQMLVSAGVFGQAPAAAAASISAATGVAPVGIAAASTGVAAVAASVL